MVDAIMADSPFSIYPNPANEQITISTPFTNGEVYQVRISDLKGSEIFRRAISEATTTIYLDGFESGIYLVEVLDANGDLQHISKQLIK